MLVILLHNNSMGGGAGLPAAGRRSQALSQGLPPGPPGKQSVGQGVPGGVGGFGEAPREGPRSSLAQVRVCVWRRGRGERELWRRRARVDVVSRQVIGLVVAGFGLCLV